MLLHKMGWVFQKVLYPTLTWRKESAGQKHIYLTFDDGPIPEMTPDILKVLKKFEAKATFFCVGDNIRKYPEIFQKTQEEGHSVGNHTYHHLNGWRTPKSSYIENIALCTEVMQQHTIKPFSSKILFRPPYGRISQTQIKALKHKYEIVMWEVLSGDFMAKLSENRCLEKTTAYTKPGSIVVFHDNLKAKKNVDSVLPRYLEYFSEQGYTFNAL